MERMGLKVRDKRAMEGVNAKSNKNKRISNN